MENKFYEMLTATVSHEMRTPLNSVISLLTTFDPFMKDAKGKKILSIIQNSAKMLLYLVNDMLDLFQIKNGKFRKNEQHFEIK